MGILTKWILEDRAECVMDTCFLAFSFPKFGTKLADSCPRGTKEASSFCFCNVICKFDLLNIIKWMVDGSGDL